MLTSHHSSVNIFKYADDTTIIGLIKDNNETHYRHEINRIVDWCNNNNLLLNTAKTTEIVIDFRKEPNLKPPVHISGKPISITESFKFLGTFISNDLKWTINTTQIIKKANQRLYFLRQLKQFHVKKQLLVLFYSAIIQSILTSSFTVWYGSIDSNSSKKLDRIVKKASKIIGHNLPSLNSLFINRITNRSAKIIRDPSHPAHHLFRLLPSGRRYMSISTKTSRFKNSFFPTAVRTLNSTR